VLSFVILLARLVGGWLFLATLRRGASKVSEASMLIMNECRHAVRLSRHTELAFHPAMASPVTLGGLSPLVLVPPDWDAWPESHRRACLLHELAHLTRYDDWAKLVEELVRIPFFFHPLVLWLLARLDRERELLCDETVVAKGADPVAYARLLFDLARCPARLLSGSSSVRAACLPFLDRGTVTIRIDRLLEGNMPQSLSDFSITPVRCRSRGPCGGCWPR
jgi:beta-lactamase regulating signal transducer with metallopeptidase domain